MLLNNTSQCSFQLGNNQDFYTSGTLCDSNGSFTYMLVADGHGSGNIISAFKDDSFPWRDVLIQPNKTLLTETLINYMIYFRLLNNSYYDGTTLSIVKIYSNYAHLIWIGDSKIQVFKNNLSYFTTNIHNCLNLTELDNCKHNLQDSWSLELVNISKIKKVKSKKIVIQNERLALTRCLGHNRLLNEDFEEKFIDFHPNENISIIAATDGFWDVAGTKDDFPALLDNNTTAMDLCKKASKRWKQSWIYYPGNNSRPYSKKFSKKSYDDITVSLWRQFA